MAVGAGRRRARASRPCRRPRPDRSSRRATASIAIARCRSSSSSARVGVAGDVGDDGERRGRASPVRTVRPSRRAVPARAAAERGAERLDRAVDLGRPSGSRCLRSSPRRSSSAVPARPCGSAAAPPRVDQAMRDQRQARGSGRVITVRPLASRWIVGRRHGRHDLRARRRRRDPLGLGRRLDDRGSRPAGSSGAACTVAAVAMRVLARAVLRSPRADSGSRRSPRRAASARATRWMSAGVTAAICGEPAVGGARRRRRRSPPRRSPRRGPSTVSRLAQRAGQQFVLRLGELGRAHRRVAEAGDLARAAPPRRPRRSGRSARIA